jgi:hypothetical protein
MIAHFSGIGSIINGGSVHLVLLTKSHVMVVFKEVTCYYIDFNKLSVKAYICKSYDTHASGHELRSLIYDSEI